MPTEQERAELRALDRKLRLYETCNSQEIPKLVRISLVSLGNPTRNQRAVNR